MWCSFRYCRKKTRRSRAINGSSRLCIGYAPRAEAIKMNRSKSYNLLSRDTGRVWTIINSFWSRTSFSFPVVGDGSGSLLTCPMPKTDEFLFVWNMKFENCVSPVKWCAACITRMPATFFGCCRTTSDKSIILLFSDLSTATPRSRRYCGTLPFDAVRTDRAQSPNVHRNIRRTPLHIGWSGRETKSTSTALTVDILDCLFPWRIDIFFKPKTGNELDSQMPIALSARIATGRG